MHPDAFNLKGILKSKFFHLYLLTLKHQEVYHTDTTATKLINAAP